MMPFFTLLGRTVGCYGLCAALGLLVCGFGAVKLGQRRALPSYMTIQAFVAVIAGLLLGGHLLYALLQLPALLAHPTRHSLWDCFGGSVYYGGLFGAWLATTWYARSFHPASQTKLLDLFALFTPLFHAFGRVGCFLGGCCYGIPCRFGFTATGNPLIPELNGVSRFPVQLLEAGCELALFFLLLRLFHTGQKSGGLIFHYLVLYAPLRFGLEFLRGDAARGMWLGLSTSQWLSIPLFLLALWKLTHEKASPIRS